MFAGTEDQAFCQHRLPMARALKAAGYEVLVCAEAGAQRARIEEEGFTFVPWNISRGSLNPFREFAAFVDFRRILRRERPDVVINVALKPILYGGLVARFTPTVRTINLFAGLGAVFINPRPAMKAVQLAVLPVLRFVLGNPRAWVVTQNADNMETLLGMGVGARARWRIIPGSGVDLHTFAPAREPEDGPIVATVLGRMLWDKGIRETVEAARILKDEGVDVRIDLVGAPDPANPASVPRDTLEAYDEEGIVRWRGPTKDVVAVWRGSHIALLPSYGEGMPKSLLEGAAMGRPMIAFDAPGSRDLVRDGENGILVPFGDAPALAAALKTLAQDAELRQRLGANARKDIETTYADDKIGAQIVDLVKTLFAGPQP